MLAARIAAATGEDGKTLELYTEALTGSRSIQEAFLDEAHAALKTSAGGWMRACLPASRSETEPPPVNARFRCDQCGVASVTWHWRCPSCRSWDSLQSVNIRGP